jgi:hypothetical protein
MHKHECAGTPTHKMVPVQSEFKVVVKGLLFILHLCKVKVLNLKPESNYPGGRYSVITESIQALLSCQSY